jgi:sulfatase modifying factor 1
MGENPRPFHDKPNNPVEMVSWNDTQVFIKCLNGMFPDLAARLPTEAEWEYACRSGTTGPFSFGDKITWEQVNSDALHISADGTKRMNQQETVSVKSLPPNAWGLYQMHGNVWEWCADWYQDYTPEAAIDPTGPKVGSLRVIRGGSFGDSSLFVRSACRSMIKPDNYNFQIGFRLALFVSEKSQYGRLCKSE